MFVPHSYLGKVVLIAAYLINRIPSRIPDDVSPIQLMLSYFPSAPIMQNLKSRVPGCAAFVHMHRQHHA